METKFEFYNNFCFFVKKRKDGGLKYFVPGRDENSGSDGWSARNVFESNVHLNVSLCPHTHTPLPTFPASCKTPFVLVDSGQTLRSLEIIRPTVVPWPFANVYTLGLRGRAEEFRSRIAHGSFEMLRNTPSPSAKLAPRLSFR